MNLQENWWKFVVLGLVIVALIMWRQQQTAPENQQALAEQMQLAQEVDQFLDEQGITLPSDGDRANLKAVEGVVGNGVAVRMVEDDKTEYTLIANLAEPDMGGYFGWLSDGTEYLSLGRMRSGKGGFILDYTLLQSGDQFNRVIVSQEEAPDQSPSSIVLEGAFE